jgi:arabinose-5-phosphate isomerase
MVDNKKSTPTTAVKYGQSILYAAAQAIQEMSDALSSNFEKAVVTLSERSQSGRIVVSGMGKAGYIGMKLSATLASIGYPSFFLHPADAIHGDLGRVGSADTIIILSHSGETSEISRLLPRLKEFGVSIISITASAASFLGIHSEVVLEIGKISEAGPLGLAPTTSTSVMLALSDALAMTLIHHRGFSREEFAIFHPGGDLGRALLTVEELMRTGDAHCIVPKDMMTRDVLHAISSTRGRPGAAAIVNENGELIGVFTDGNLRRCLESNTTFLEQPIIEVASLQPKTITRSQLATEAAHIIGSLQIDQLIVVDDLNHPIGLVDIQDLLSHGMIKPRE